MYPDLPFQPSVHWTLFEGGDGWGLEPSTVHAVYRADPLVDPVSGISLCSEDLELDSGYGCLEVLYVYSLSGN